MPERTPEEIPTDDPRPDGLRRASSRVILNTGPGKGKTSAAVGMVIRAVARDWNVAVFQFLKSGRWHTGEEKVCRELGVDWWTGGEGFTWESTDLDVDHAKAAGTWADARAVIAAGRHRLVVLDEITYPINWCWIDLAEVVEAIGARPANVNVVLTGRNAPPALVEIADTVSEVGNVKHAYESGVRAMKGIDY